MDTQERRISTGYTPHRWQDQIHRRLKRFSVLACHRRFGKTYLAIAELVDRALGFTGGDGRFGYIAPYRNQAKAIAWDYLLKFCMVIPGATANQGDLYISLPNGSRIRLYGADNAEAIRGIYFDGVVLDEVALMPPTVWGEIIRPTLADRKGWAIFIGTPRGINLFFELWQRGQQGDPEWWSDIYRADETGILPEAELVTARADMSDAQYRQEFLCDWSASTDDSLISIDLASAAAGRSLREEDIRSFPTVIGVDPARFGDDRSCIIRRVGPVAMEPIVLNGIDNMQLAARVARAMLDWGCDSLFIDAGGGAGPIDILRAWGHPVTEVNFGGKATDPRYKNKRVEMWDRMAQWLREGGCIPNISGLKTDLTGPRYWYDPANRMCLEMKEDMKARGLRSPDIADALALTFAFPVAMKLAPYAPGSLLLTAPRGGLIHEYDPLTFEG